MKESIVFKWFWLALYHWIMKRVVIPILSRNLLRRLILNGTIKDEDGFDLNMDIFGKMIYFYSYWMFKSKVELWDKENRDGWKLLETNLDKRDQEYEEKRIYYYYEKEESLTRSQAHKS